MDDSDDRGSREDRVLPIIATTLQRSPDGRSGSVDALCRRGLYGNRPALDAIELMASLEGAVLVFNGDFHWFDRNSAIFSQVRFARSPHHALRGNVENRIEPHARSGCGVWMRLP
ncbi:hypothetical protein I6G78_30310, partial (plasmid) [Burkholderia glumae]